VTQANELRQLRRPTLSCVTTGVFHRGAAPQLEKQGKIGGRSPRNAGKKVQNKSSCGAWFRVAGWDQKWSTNIASCCHNSTQCWYLICDLLLSTCVLRFFRQEPTSQNLACRIWELRLDRKSRPWTKRNFAPPPPSSFARTGGRLLSSCNVQAVVAGVLQCVAM